MTEVCRAGPIIRIFTNGILGAQEEEELAGDHIVGREDLAAIP